MPVQNLIFSFEHLYADNIQEISRRLFSINETCHSVNFGVKRRNPQVTLLSKLLENKRKGLQKRKIKLHKNINRQKWHGFPEKYVFSFKCSCLNKLYKNSQLIFVTLVLVNV